LKTIALSLLLLATTAVADIGSVTDVKGVAVIKRGSNTINVAKGTLIETNDKVETKNGVVNITFKDNTTVKVTESSSLVIDDFVYDPKSSAGKLGMKATSGTVRYVSGNIAHNNPNSVNIKTPTAAIAVRGTDFVMSVDETGKSAVILMPACEDNIIKGTTCGSGAIDVNSGGDAVHMDKPYQATMVETSATAPLPPIIVDLGFAPVGNNIMLNGLRTPGGVTIQVAARTAAEKTGDAKKSSGDSKDSSDASAEQTAAVTNNTTSDSAEATEDTKLVTNEVTVDSLKKLGINVKDKSTGDEHVYQIFRDSSNTQQIGWGYESISASGKNYVNIALNLDSDVLVFVVQDRLGDAFNYSSSPKNTGSIIINQVYK
jgi:hypothetical protein